MMMMTGVFPSCSSSFEAFTNLRLSPLQTPSPTTHLDHHLNYLENYNLALRAGSLLFKKATEPPRHYLILDNFFCFKKSTIILAKWVTTLYFIEKYE